MFEKIEREEKNERTALILMLSVLSEKLTEIDTQLQKANKLSADILSCLKTAIERRKTEILVFTPIEKEDYMD